MSGLSDPTARRMLVIRRHDGAVSGMINFSQIFRGPFRNAVMGYWLGEGFTGQGLMTDGVRQALSYAFGPLKLHRVEANVMPENEASLAVVRRVGFREEGFSLRYLQINGRWRDHVRFALTLEDWRTLRRKTRST